MHLDSRVEGCSRPAGTSVVRHDGLLRGLFSFVHVKRPKCIQGSRVCVDTTVEHSASGPRRAPATRHTLPTLDTPTIASRSYSAFFQGPPCRGRGEAPLQFAARFGAGEAVLPPDRVAVRPTNKEGSP